jgi:nitroreductase
MELREVIRQRRMVRSFVSGRPVDTGALDRVLDAARRGPSAGFAQPVDLLVLDEATDRARFWDLSFPVPQARAEFRWQGLFDAPVVIVPVVEPDAYARRYSEPDKAGTGLDDLDAWPAPYWWIDGGAAVQNLLLSAVDEGLGALLFGLFVHEREILDAFGVPANRRALGAVALGHPRPDEPGRSSGRRRRALVDVTHRGRW